MKRYILRILYAFAGKDYLECAKAKNGHLPGIIWFTEPCSMEDVKKFATIDIDTAWPL